MSKRPFTGQSNTLFNYFQSPKDKQAKETKASPGPHQSSTKDDSKENEHKSGGDEHKPAKIVSFTLADTDSEEELTPSKKRCRKLDSDSDEDDLPKENISKKVKVFPSTSAVQSTSLGESSTSSGPKPKFEFERILKNVASFPPPRQFTPSKRKTTTPKRATTPKHTPSKGTPSKSTPPKAATTPKSKGTPKGKGPSKSKLALQFLRAEYEGGASTSSMPSTSSQQSSQDEEGRGKFTHEKLDFLKPEHIRDHKERKPSDKDYDPRTIHIPDPYLKTVTPAMRQWWELKRKHMDCVLFFKVGKFYELYHMDAVVGVQHLDFSYMKGDFAHSGFPESAFGKMAQALVEKGFKVARVEQTETPEMMNARCQKTGKHSKFDKVVEREICEISMKGACVYGPQLMEAVNAKPDYMMAICEKLCHLGKTKRVGVCFVDTSIGVFHVCEFIDDLQVTRLAALITENPPALLLTEKELLSTETTAVVKSLIGNSRWEPLLVDYEFYNTVRVFTNLNSNNYFLDQNKEQDWPPIFQEIMDGGFFKHEYELLTKSFGACMWYLQQCNLDIQLICRRKFKMYAPIDVDKKVENITNMILDATTINNLKLLGGAGTLQKSIDCCSTRFGKRLLQQWICRPLINLEQIQERQHAVNELYQKPDLLRNTRELFSKLPDIERHLAKVFIYSSKCMADFHPDGRAVFYEAKTYSKRRIQDFLGLLVAFEKVCDVTKKFKGCRSRYLIKLTQCAPDGMFIDLKKTLVYFKDAFNHQMAREEGRIIPQKGVDLYYDSTTESIAHIQKDLDEYLKKQCVFLKCEVKYFGHDKKRFQLEIPEKSWSLVPEGYHLEGTKNGLKPCKRFSTPITKKLLSRMLAAEHKRDKCLTGLSRRIFEKFANNDEQWEKVLHCVTILDCLCSLAEYARTNSDEMSMPILLPFCDNPITNIQNGRHPCMTNIENFVPNHTELGPNGEGKILILIGPNMGGKSTLMKQVALISVMAQMGSFVPAASCEMTLIDRIFTRMGSSDNIFNKESTFYLELSEARSILQHATKHSLAIIDELGRGTSTHDGNAIATAYLNSLRVINCRSVFSTHYHSLVEFFQTNKLMQLGHMAFMIGANEEDPTRESVTFLYKLAPGNCPKSFGFNVAHLAGLPDCLVDRARDVAYKLESETKGRKFLHDLHTIKDAHKLRELLKNMKFE